MRFHVKGCSHEQTLCGRVSQAKVTYNVNVLHVLVLLAEVADIHLPPHFGVLAVHVALPLKNYFPLVEKYLSKVFLRVSPDPTQQD